MAVRIILMGLFFLTPAFVFSQDYASATNTGDTTALVREVDPEMTQTIFYNESSRRNQKGCSFIQNPWRDRKLKVTKKGYVLETQDEDEVVKVKNYGKGKNKITYSNDYEDLKYKTKNGKVTYKYTYINECKKVKVKKDKNGVTSVKNKSGMDTGEVRHNTLQAINRGVHTCQNMGH